MLDVLIDVNSPRCNFILRLLRGHEFDISSAFVSSLNRLNMALLKSLLAVLSLGYAANANVWNYTGEIATALTRGQWPYRRACHCGRCNSGKFELHI